MSMTATAAAPRPASHHDDYRPDPDRWMALGVVLAAGFMTLLDVSIVNVALASIDRGLQPPRRIARRLRVGVPVRHRQPRRVRRRCARPHACGHIHAWRLSAL